MKSMQLQSMQLGAARAILVLAAALCCRDAVAGDGSGTTLVNGFMGEPTGGFRQSWYTHRGFMPLFGVRQSRPDLTIAWKSAPLPKELSAKAVTFVWSGGTGAVRGGAGNFTVYVNGHAAADFDVAVRPARFRPREEGCELLYDARWAYSNRLDSSGDFFLTIPSSWVRPGEAADLEVRAKDVGTGAWFALIEGEDVAAPDRRPMKPFDPRPLAADPPPAGEEASYEWYLPQFPDPGIYTPIGPPGDPAETAVTPEGHLVSAVERANSSNNDLLPGTPFVRNSLVFALCDDNEVVPFGTGSRAHQAIADGRLPIVTTTWRHRDIEVREVAFAEPLRSDAYDSGRESTLAWAAFDLSNRAADAREVTFLAAQMGDEKTPKLDLVYRGGVVFRKASALLSSTVTPAGFEMEFVPEFVPGGMPPPLAGGDPFEVLRSRRGLYNALVFKGKIEAGKTARLILNRVFDFPGTWYWEPDPPVVAPEELTKRRFDDRLGRARAAWNRAIEKVARFQTPDSIVDRMAAKAMLDGYFLTKRWDGKTIVFDSVPYRCQWDDASTKWFYALDLLGDHETAGRLLETVFERQGSRKPAGTRTHEGCFSDVANTKQDGSAASWASCNGWALWAIAEHARLTNDRAWIEKHKAKIVEGCRWIMRERQFSREKPGEPCAGLIHGKFVCDLADAGEGGASGVGYFTYTDAISYMGLNEVAHVLSDWGHTEGKELREEADRYRADIAAAVDRLTDRSQDPWYVPWVLHAPKHVSRYFYDVCGPINLAFACGNGGVLPRDDDRIGHVIRWVIEKTHHGSIESATAGIIDPAEGAMFYSQDLAITLLESGRVEDFLRIFYTLLASNVSHETLTTCEWGRNTQPHIHSIGSLIRMLRTMLVEERDEGLYLLQGVPRRWLAQGKQIVVREAPTWYGPLSIRASSDIQGGAVNVRLAVPERIGAAPIHLKLRLPDGFKVEEVTVNGREGGEVRGEWVALSGLKGEVEVTAKVAR